MKECLQSSKWLFQSPWSLPLCPDSLKRSCLPPWMATSLMQAHLLSGSFGYTAFRTQPFTTPSTYWVANHATNAYASPWRWSGIGIDCDCQWQTICNATGNNWICIKHMTIVSLPILHLPALHSLGPCAISCTPVTRTVVPSVVAGVGPGSEHRLLLGKDSPPDAWWLLNEPRCPKL